MLIFTGEKKTGSFAKIDLSKSALRKNPTSRWHGVQARCGRDRDGRPGDGFEPNAGREEPEPQHSETFRGYDAAPRSVFSWPALGQHSLTTGRTWL